MANLAKALHQLRQERTLAQRQVEKLNEAISVIERLVNSGIQGARKVKRPRRKMSVAARKRISLAQKARWAKWKVKQEKKAA